MSRTPIARFSKSTNTAINSSTDISNLVLQKNVCKTIDLSVCHAVRNQSEHFRLSGRELASGCAGSSRKPEDPCW
jgi:hypothetical protein